MREVEANAMQTEPECRYDLTPIPLLHVSLMLDSWTSGINR
jgi:hypothetical protein